MGTVETFDHTADVGLRVRAADLDDLFATAAAGMFDYVVANRADIEVDRVETFRLTADGPAELLVEWLGELLFRAETGHRLYRDFQVRVAPDENELEATVGGGPIDFGRDVLDHEVKAVTRHGLVLERDGSDWRAEFILDI